MEVLVLESLCPAQSAGSKREVECGRDLVQATQLLSLLESS